MTALRFYLAVAWGSALGAGLRYLLALAAAALMGPAFWAGTLGANLAGSGLIAWYSTRAARHPCGRLARWHGFWTVGVCGGFTTFSLFGVEAVMLWQRQQPALAAGYVAASLVGWLAAARVGQRLAERQDGE
ncbi:CrcB family protein [Halomonas piscis]|uniref:Fluoride-specific ion channel FluC n=1 Tax=Halomonas piscis TaxID=3031727 RepID=A0ABY9Z037_9GAMM|nr:CrcB family protein [Halomonas piscis]WNK20396.1 CrcB family protein [Halomonas piscis]